MKFPKDVSKEINEGNIHFFKPNDAAYDRIFKIDPKNGMQGIPKNELIAGKYEVKISWKANEKDYYVEKTLIIDME